MMDRFFNKQGKPITFEEYCSVSEDYKRVAQDTVLVDGIEVWLSTVWLGIDHSRAGFGYPVIFESMIFMDSDHDHSHHNWMDRYSTLEEAQSGHAAILGELSAGRWPS